MTCTSKKKNAQVGAQLSTSEVVHQKRAKEIGLRIKDVRGRLNQSEFATMLGVHRSTVSRYERGKFEPNIEFLNRICSKFGININWLLFGKGPKCLPEKASSLIEPDERKTIKRAQEKDKGIEKQALEAPGTVNVALLAQILEGIDIALNDMSLELAPDKKAELTALLYEHFGTVGVKRETIKRFLKLVA